MRSAPPWPTPAAAPTAGDSTRNRVATPGRAGYVSEHA